MVNNMTMNDLRVLNRTVNMEFNGGKPASYFIDPSAAFVTLTTGAGDFGAWTVIEDSATVDYLITGLMITVQTVNEVGCIEIGIGAAPSAAKIQVITEVTTTLDSIYYQFPHPIWIKKAEAVYGRFYTATDASTVLVKMVAIAGSEGEGTAGGNFHIRHVVSALCDTERNNIINVLPAPSSGQVTPVSVTANNSWTVNSANYTQLVASTSWDCWITHIVLCESATPATYMELDIAIGAAASEVVVAQTPVKMVSANEMMVIPLGNPIPVYKASRLAARARGSAATAVKVALLVTRGLSQ